MWERRIWSDSVSLWPIMKVRICCPYKPCWNQCVHIKNHLFLKWKWGSKVFPTIPSPDVAKVSGSSALNMWNAEKSSSQQWKIQFSLKERVFWTRPLPQVWSSKMRIILHFMSHMAVAVKGFVSADSSAATGMSVWKTSTPRCSLVSLQLCACTASVCALYSNTWGHGLKRTKRVKGEKNLCIWMSWGKNWQQSAFVNIFNWIILFQDPYRLDILKEELAGSKEDSSRINKLRQWHSLHGSQQPWQKKIPFNNHEECRVRIIDLFLLCAVFTYNALWNWAVWDVFLQEGQVYT